MCGLKLNTNLIFVVDRGSETQLQVAENVIERFKWLRLISTPRLLLIILRFTDYELTPPPPPHPHPHTNVITNVIYCRPFTCSDWLQ